MIILQSETNGLESENNRLTSSLSSSYDGSPLYLRDNSTHSIYTLDQIKVIRSQLCSRYDKHLQQHNHILTINNKFGNSSKTSFNSQSTRKEIAIHLNKNNMETRSTKRERNGT
ncbi:unnamed protein product [Rotaria sp. Silwood2]|nr:unnamed protein product [Rotaria sp. Silwood2]CAF3009649.1 unnamed protein product [Rotaria sp. Silwood2]CAF3939541.1 unnamed protein product [Rotaria sp. Silwood2]CAF4071198.1 unnamed protein product [Rotaria sp. Silwood2]